MSAEKRSFSRISVSAEEEDDLVIEAGAVAAAGAADDADEATEGPRTEAAPSAGERSADAGALSDAADADQDGDADVDAEDGGAPADAGAGQAERRGRGERAGTSLEDLETAKMGGRQKAIVAIAALAVIGFAVYYMFFR